SHCSRLHATQPEPEPEPKPEPEPGPESASVAAASSGPDAAGAGGEPDDDEEEQHDPHFDPIISLPLVQLPVCEAHEETMLQLRAKLFRMDRSGEVPEWKERGTGDVKILRHKTKPSTRLLMRRDKTLKVCANHFMTQDITLMPNCGSDRAWVWSVACDFSDEEPKPEMLAIRFANAENAKKFKEVFTEAQKIMQEGNQPAAEQPESESKPPPREASGEVADQ
ncbi:ran-specific GTPase-activating protein-like, partial [Pollicipes pollicipes]|uniref:ran-specific GTPase-activating protein-like n=1 Tax=Pollicipes pollicipes TaxID=41117 RepID=UPI00188555D3